jgi:acetyl-CoA synthetase
VNKIFLKNNRIKNFNLTSSQYNEMYHESIEHPELFFSQVAKQFIEWFNPWEQIKTGSFSHPPIEWFKNAKLNITHNCIDRHLPKHANKTAIIWEGNEPSNNKTISYQELHDEVGKFANIYKANGVKAGDVICIYMPMIPEAVFAMLAAARIGAIHNVVFGGFSSTSLANRIQDSQAKFLVTANAANRGEKLIEFKNIVDTALKDCTSVKNVLVMKHADISCKMQPNRDLWHHEAIKNVSNNCPAAPMNSQDPLFILYTSGSTGKPKGILHSSGGYAVYAAMTYYYLFNHQDNTKHFCTADIGWITGHTYTVYGPLLNGGTTIIYEGVPNYPNFSRLPAIIEHHQATNFYTAPTLLRTLRHEGNDFIKPYQLESLQLLGSVGEPIAPDVWEWFFETFGKNKCPIINTWWQTESGGVLLSSLPSDDYFIPGSAGKPFFGVKPVISQNSMLYIQNPWPGLMQTIYQDNKRFIDSYLPQPELGYLTGDGAFRDENGDYHISGRLDDIIKVSGHRLGTEELESALISSKSVSEAAVIGVPHPIKGEAIIAFVILQKNINPSPELVKLLTQHLRNHLGAIATPERIIWVSGLPKTRSGKIMRRILKKICAEDYDNIGDTSSLSEPNVIQDIIHACKQRN